jgi:hypothetical protein
MANTPSAEEVKLRAAFETARTALFGSDQSDRLEKPLAFWVLPNDRRLPISFLPRLLKDLLAVPFADLAATPGIGRKKMFSLVKLLCRALKTDPSALASFPAEKTSRKSATSRQDENQFDAEQVSELVWAQWRQMVHAHGLGYERVGRLCTNLQDVPTVIWNTPLEFYLNLTLADIRALKTHGEKRVRVVLEVFHAVHRMLTTIQPLAGLAVRLQPRFVVELENALAAFRAQGGPPTLAQLERALVDPLLHQLELDCGQTIATIARGRLRVGTGAAISVREQARKLGVTRARVYQLLEECSQVMQVRWPEGRQQLDGFAHWLDEIYASAECANLLATVRELLFPLKYDPVTEHLLKDATEQARTRVAEV